jgi:nitroreductase
MKNDILKAYNNRHACKIFDDSKKIPKEDLEFLLEIVRLSPSSFGMEHWHLLIVQNEELKKKLKPLCWNQNQITTCSDLVIFLAKTKDLEAKSQYTRNMLKRKNLPKEQIEAYFEKYDNFVKDKQIDCWSSKQCYIAGGNMASAAAMIGIDSCFIEGFEKENVEKLLEIDTDKFTLTFMLALGYRVNDIPKKYRLNLEEITTFIK